MERNPEAQCVNCPYWFPMNKLPNGTLVGQCRETTPKVFMIPVRNPIGLTKTGDMEFVEGFEMRPQCPQTTSDFVCGEHPDFLLDDETDDAERVDPDVAGLTEN